MYRLNAATGDKTGLGITLKVMSGDMVDVYGKSFWHSNGTLNNNYPISSVLTNFVTAFAGSPTVLAGAHATGSAVASAINGNATDLAGIRYLLDTAKSGTGSTPRAYINWILFDNQFNPVRSGSGFDLVSTTADNVKSHHSTVAVGANGYLYVYCSNESNFNVFFDNLQVIHTRGPLLENTEYYPGGLMMAGISDKVLKYGYAENKHLYNGKEIQNKEFSDGSGLEVYDYGARMQDPQLMTWHNIDPKPEISRRWSPYNYAYDNPIRFNDPDGMVPGDFFDQQGNKIGTDGKQDGKKYIALSQSATNDIKNQTAAGKNVVLSADDKKGIIENPTNGEIKAMTCAYSRTEANGMREEGFQVGKDKNRNQIIVNNPAGTSNEHATNVQAWNDLKAKGSVMTEYGAHTHGAEVKVEANGDIIIGVPRSSPGDRSSPDRAQPNAVLGYQVNGMSDVPAADLQKATNSRGTYVPLSNYPSLPKVITYYKSSGNIISMDYSKFKATVQKVTSSQ